MKFYNVALLKILLICLGNLLSYVPSSMASSGIPNYDMYKFQTYGFIGEGMRHIVPILDKEHNSSLKFNFGSINGKINTTSKPSLMPSCSTNLQWNYNNYLNSNFIGNNINSSDRSFHLTNKSILLNGKFQVKQDAGFDEVTGGVGGTIIQLNYSFLNLYSKFLYSEQNREGILYFTGKLPFHMKLDYGMHNLLNWDPEWFSQITFEENKKLFMTYGFSNEYGWSLKSGAIFDWLNGKYGIVNSYNSENECLYVTFAMNPHLSKTDYDVFDTAQLKDSGILEYVDFPGYQGLTNDGLEVDLTRQDQALEVGGSWHFHLSQGEFLRQKYDCSFWVGEHYDFGLQRNIESAGIHVSNDLFAVDLGGDNQNNLTINFSANL